MRERGSFERDNLTVEAIDGGDYELGAVAGTTESHRPDSVGTLRLERRSTAGARSWVAPQDADLTDGDVGLYEESVRTSRGQTR